MQDIIIDTTEASQILGITREAVQLLLKRGRIEGQKKGRQWFVVKSSVLAYKKEREERLAQRGQKED